MARISPGPPQTLGNRLGARYSRRRYGVMLGPGAANGPARPAHPAPAGPGTRPGPR